MKTYLKAAAVLFVSAMTLAHAQVEVDPALKSYKTTGGVSGNLTSIGSDTLANMTTLWQEGYKLKYPNVTTESTAQGSSTAPPALIEGSSQVGPMSRPMKSSEIDEFEKKFGYKPTPVRVAIDALAVFVHKDNPVKGLSLEQVDSVFSSTRKRNGKEVAVWGDLGVTGEWATMPFSIYGRNSASGTYGFFKEHVLKKGDYKASVKEQPGSSAVVQSVANERAGIGYSGIGYKTASVRAVPLSEKGTDYVEANMENCLSGDYPLSRFLYIYVNKAPNKPLDKLTLEYLKFALSKEGQQIVVKDGYFPLPAAIAEEDIAMLSK